MIRLCLLLLPMLLLADIDEQIEAIQHAPLKERFKLMNAFKNRVIQMREEERLQALHKLQTMTKEKATLQSLQNLHKKSPQDLIQGDMHEEKVEILTNEESEKVHKFEAQEEREDEREEHEKDDDEN